MYLRCANQRENKMSLKAEKVQEIKTTTTLTSTPEVRTTQVSSPKIGEELNKFGKSSSAQISTSTTETTLTTSTSNTARAEAHQKEVDDVAKTKELAAGKNKPLIPLSKTLSDSWMKKTSDKKAQDYVSAYLTKTNGNATSKEIWKETKELARSLSSGKKTLTKGDYDKVPILLEALNAQNISIKEYKKLSPEKQLELYRTAQINAQKNFINAITSDKDLMAKVQNAKSAREKISIIADAVLCKQLGKEYSDKPEQERKTLIKNKSDEFISQYIPNWNEIPEENKDVILHDKLIELQAMTNKDMSFDEFKSLGISKQWEYIREYKYQNNEQEQTSKEDEAYDRILHQYLEEHNGKDPTIDELSELIKNDKSTDDETKTRLLGSLNVNKAFNNGQNAKIERHVTYEDRVRAFAGDKNIDIKEAVQKELNEDLKSLSKCKNSQEQEAKLIKILQSCGENEELRQIALNNVNQILPQDVINSAFKKSKTAQMAALKAVRNNDGVGMANVALESEKYKDTKIANITAQMIPMSVTREQGIQGGVVLANANAKCLDAYTTGVNQRPDAVSYSSAVVQSENMSSAGRAVYTQSAVKTASAEQQVEYSREFSKLDYPEVTEGLAAASKYVDKNVKSEYNSYVEKAIKNYPPEQQAQIRKALETGKISAETLSKNTVTSNSSSKTADSSNANANKTGATNTNTATPTTSSPIKQQATATNSGAVANGVPTAGNISTRTSVTDTPSVSSVATSARASEVGDVNEVSSTPRTSLSSNMSSDDVDVLTEKSQAVLNKIEDFISTQKASIEEYEAQKAEKAEHLSEEEIVKAVASGDIALEDLKLSKEEVATLKETLTILFEKNSISTAYKKLVSKFGKLEDVFLRAFAENADSSTLRSFAGDFRNNTDVILKLFKYSKDNSLLAFLPKDTIIALFGKDIDGSEIPQDILWSIISEYDKKGETDKADKFRVFLKEGAGIQTTQNQTTANNTSSMSMSASGNNSNSSQALTSNDAPAEKIAKTPNKQSESTVPPEGSDAWFANLQHKKSDGQKFLVEEKIATEKTKKETELSNKNTDLYAFSGNSDWLDDNEWYPASSPAFVANSKRKKGKDFDKKVWYT